MVKRYRSATPDHINLWDEEAQVRMHPNNLKYDSGFDGGYWGAGKYVYPILKYRKFLRRGAVGTAGVASYYVRKFRQKKRQAPTNYERVKRNYFSDKKQKLNDEKDYPDEKGYPPPNRNYGRFQGSFYKRPQSVQTSSNSMRYSGYKRYRSVPPFYQRKRGRFKKVRFRGVSKKKLGKMISREVSERARRSPRCHFRQFSTNHVVTTDGACAYQCADFFGSGDCETMLKTYGPDIVTYNAAGTAMERKTDAAFDQDATNRPYAGAKIQFVPVSFGKVIAQNNDNVCINVEIRDFLCIDHTSSSPTDLHEEWLQKAQGDAASTALTNINYTLGDSLHYMRRKWKQVDVKRAYLRPGESLNYKAHATKATFDSFWYSQNGSSTYYKGLSRCVVVRVMGSIVHQNNSSNMTMSDGTLDLVDIKRYNYVVINPRLIGTAGSVDTSLAAIAIANQEQGGLNYNQTNPDQT